MHLTCTFCTGQPAYFAFQLAIDEINNNANILPQHKLRAIISDTRSDQGTTTCCRCVTYQQAFFSHMNCFQKTSLVDCLGHTGHQIIFTQSVPSTPLTSAALTLQVTSSMIQQGAVAIVGENNSAITSLVALMAKPTMIPTMTYGSSATDFSNKVLYPNVLRPVPAVSTSAVFAAALCKKLGWTRVSLLSTDDTFAKSCSSAFTQGVAARQMTLVTSEVFFSAGDATKSVANIKASKVRVIFFCGVTGDLATALRQGYAAGIGNKRNGQRKDRTNLTSLFVPTYIRV